MKHTARNIFLLFLLPLAALSCGREEAAPTDVRNVVLDWPGYIWFGSDVRTRTTGLESMNGRSFNVIAFKYGSDWATFKATGTPASAEGTAGFVFPTKVSCASDGTCSYKSSDGTNPVEWDGVMKYSFFAYYPTSDFDLASTVLLVSDHNTSGVPAIKYTVPDPESDGFMDATKIPDVMTAHTTDIQNTGAGVVALKFKHRLCLFCVEARNLKKTDATISDLKLIISSYRYSEVTIPLDGSELQPSGLTEDDFQCRMQPASGDGASVTVPEFGKDGTSANTRVSYPDCHIAFIPQDPSVIGDEGLEGSLSFDWNGEPMSQTFKYTKAFKEGTMYAFIITIAADDAISIDIQESGEWGEKRNDIIFE